LVQQAEATNEYGSWDACCARTGIDCYLTRQAVPLGYEPCDLAHGARAGCNRVSQGTLCMIGTDGSINGSPCGTSLVRTCTSTIVLNGTTVDFSAALAGAATSILTTFVLGSELCCSTSSCVLAGPYCTDTYGMTCVSDGTNIICVPFDQTNGNTYGIALVQDGHGCATTTITTTQSLSTSLSTSSIVTASGKKRKMAAVGGAVGGVVGIVCIAAFTILCRQRYNVHNGSNPHTQKFTTETNKTRATPFPSLTTAQVMITPPTSPPFDQEHIGFASTQPTIGSDNHAIAETDLMAERIAALEVRLAAAEHREQSGEIRSTIGGETAPPPYE